MIYDTRKIVIYIICNLSNKSTLKAKRHNYVFLFYCVVEITRVLQYIIFTAMVSILFCSNF